MALRAQPLRTSPGKHWWKLIDQDDQFIVQEHATGVWPYLFRVLRRLDGAELASANSEAEIRADFGHLRRIPQPSSGSKTRFSEGESRQRATQEPLVRKAPSVGEYASILGLAGCGPFTPAEIKQAYHARVNEYHPDKVATMGPKLRALAEEETRKINEAHEYFRIQFQRQFSPA